MTSSVWNPDAIELAQVNAAGVMKEESFIATLSQVLFTLTSYTYAINTGSILIYKNGALLTKTVDYIETSTSSFTLNASSSAGDRITAVGFVGVTGTSNADATLRADLLASSGSSIVRYIRTGATGAVTHTLQDTVSYQEVWDWQFLSAAQMADFREGTKTLDISVAYQAMIDSVGTYPTIFRISSGAGRWDNPITFPESLYAIFQGNGIGITTFEFFGTGNAITSASNTSNRQKISFYDFELFNHAGNTNALNGIYVKNGQYWSNFKNVFVHGFTKTGTQTIGSFAYKYAGVLLVSCWGAAWDRVQLRGNAVGAVTIISTGTYKNLDVQGNQYEGLIVEDCSSSYFGGVFEGNGTVNYNDPTKTDIEAEIKFIGGESKLFGAFIEGEGTNPPYSIIVTGRSATARSFGTSIIGCAINRSTNTNITRGCIYLDYDEGTVIQGCSIQPTCGDVGSSAIPHISVTANTKNPKIGKNHYRGRDWHTGGFYVDACPVFLPAELAALAVPYSFDSVGGGLTTDLKKIQHNWYFAGPLTAPQAESNGNCNGGVLQKATWIEKLSWITGVILHLPAGQSAGNLTIRIYNQVNGTGANVLVKTIVQTSFSGAAHVAFAGHAYQLRVDTGRFFVTIQTDAGFLAVAASEAVVQVFLVEDDTH